MRGQFLLFFGSLSAIGWCQKPVISSGGVVNAASYAITTNTYGAVGHGISAGSIVSIFGTSLAVSTERASTVPLPTEMAGTTVSVSGLAAPLFYVSPNQINFQMPSCSGTCPPYGSPPSIVVSNGAGSSEPYRVDLGGAEGLFTSDATGCGQGAALNVRSDGSISVNSVVNSVSPREYISIFGTGLEYVENPPPDGVPAPSSPLKTASISASQWDFAPNPTPNNAWAGRAPGLIGVDQFNFYVSDTVREGCAVPLQVADSYGMSQPVTISIRKGGGPCQDPPSVGYGQITWEKTVTMSTEPTVGSTIETDTLTASLQSSPGKQAPPKQIYTEGIGRRGQVYFGASCRVPGYRSLDAGAISVQAPSLGSSPSSAVPLPGPVRDLMVHEAVLPTGTIGPGAYSVTATGGSDVGPFHSTVQIGSEIHITTSMAGRLLDSTQPVSINWTGGDQNSWVTFTLIRHLGYMDVSAYVQARASAGIATISTVGGFLPVEPGPVEVVLEVDPDPSLIQTFSAPGLSLGGRHTWKYTYRFEDVTIR